MGDSDDTSVKLGVLRDVKRNAGATDGSDLSRHRAVSSIRSDADTCAECSKQCNNDCRNDLKYQFTLHHLAFGGGLFLVLRSLAWRSDVTRTTVVSLMLCCI